LSELQWTERKATLTFLSEARRGILLSAIAACAAICVIWLNAGSPASADSQNDSATAVTVRTIETVEPIPYPTHRVPSSELRTGTTKTVRTGVQGQRSVVYEVTYRGDREVARKALSSRVTRQPSPEVVYVGTSEGTPSRGRYAARGYFSGRRVVTMIATGYDPNPASNGGTSRTSTGIKVGYGLVAVDPKFIPIGTKLYIEGYGYAVAADVGGAIKGNRIDLGHDSARGARMVGRRLVRVHILN
jgi:3D (Asp-Asp-Asp) domain-containing protein